LESCVCPAILRSTARRGKGKKGKGGAKPRRGNPEDERDWEREKGRKKRSSTGSTTLRVPVASGRKKGGKKRDGGQADPRDQSSPQPRHRARAVGEEKEKKEITPPLGEGEEKEGGPPNDAVPTFYTSSDVPDQVRKKKPLCR